MTPGAVAFRSDHKNEQADRQISDWPTIRALDNQIRRSASSSLPTDTGQMAKDSTGRESRGSLCLIAIDSELVDNVTTQ